MSSSSSWTTFRCAQICSQMLSPLSDDTSASKQRPMCIRWLAYVCLSMLSASGGAVLAQNLYIVHQLSESSQDRQLLVRNHLHVHTQHTTCQHGHLFISLLSLTIHADVSDTSCAQAMCLLFPSVCSKCLPNPCLLV
jgi:hypothetical protein